LDEIEPAQGVPRTITEALGEELTEPHQTVRLIRRCRWRALAHASRLWRERIRGGHRRGTLLPRR
jgi:hypothetical protein